MGESSEASEAEPRGSLSSHPFRAELEAQRCSALGRGHATVRRAALLLPVTNPVAQLEWRHREERGSQRQWASAYRLCHSARRLAPAYAH